MLFRYPGKGKSIPSVRTVATSVPLSPTGPPPARGPSLFWAAAFGVSIGVDAAFGAFAAAFSIGAFFITVSGAGVVTGGVLTAVGSAPTVPIARGPAGAATMFTRYTGGSETLAWLLDMAIT